MRPRITIVTGVTLLIIAVSMYLPALQMPSEGEHCAELGVPILCAELSESGAELQALLLDPINSLDLWRRQLYLDMPFLLAYGLMLSLAALAPDLLFAKGRRAWIGRGLAGLFISAALFDVFENVGLLLAIERVELLSSPVGSSFASPVEDGMADWIASNAKMKFTLLNLGVLGLSLRNLKLDAPRSQKGLNALAAIAAGLGIWAPLWTPLWTAAVLSISLACIAALVAGVRELRAGQRQAPAAS